MYNINNHIKKKSLHYNNFILRDYCLNRACKTLADQYNVIYI